MDLFTHKIRVSGFVQGVGFRPFVYQLATELGLTGYVENQNGHVQVLLEGSSEQLVDFHQGLTTKAPEKAIIKDILVEDEPITTQHYSQFEIHKSSQESYQTQSTKDFPLDYGVCKDCVIELFDKTNPRYHFPFISCTHCGPRFSITTTLPFDRQSTSMASFDLCSKCENEYDTPDNRRFHAQTISCPQCGPGLSLTNNKREQLEGRIFEPLYQALNTGKIVAIKGTGGFHLVCNAEDSAAVNRLRAIKHRPYKPLAVMGLNLESFDEIVLPSESLEQQFNDDKAPIVLAPKQVGCDQVLQEIAPQSPNIGLIKPYNPIYLMLFEEAAKQQHGSDIDSTEWLNAPLNFFLAVTSANLSGEPLITENQDCLDKLGEHVDMFLIHNLKIKHPLDDSVAQACSSPSTIRLGRSYAPLSMPSKKPLPSVLACGAHLKNTFCLSKDNQRWVSPHIGSLNTKAQCAYFRDTIYRYLEQYKVKPEGVACDLNPDVYSSLLARDIAKELDIPLLPVQHHHAHIAAVLAEHQLDANCIGVALDGFGLGENRTGKSPLWGGELFKVSNLQFERIGHFSEIQLPGGEKAAKEPWRIAYAITREFDPELAYKRFASLANIPNLEQLLIASLSSDICPTTSSAGRWFDAFAALLGFDGSQSFEGQAAMYLEYLANQCSEPVSSHGLVPINNNQLELRPLFQALSLNKDPVMAAKVFHTELIDGIARWIVNAAEQTGHQTIVCSGGCFQNRILREGLASSLAQASLKVYFPNKLPANDAGISLGQAHIAQYRLLHPYK